MTMFRSSPDRYGLIARLFHAAVAATILANLALGLLFDDAVETGEGRFAALHATLGVITLALLVARILWRLIDPPPPVTVGTPIERTAAHAGHLGLYALALLVTLSGWLVASAGGGRIDLLAGMTLPSLSASPAVPAATPATIAAADDAGVVDVFVEDEDAGDGFWEEVHELGSWALLALIALHTAAALMHRRRKDGTWERMFG